MEDVGVVSIGTYIPEKRMTAQQLAQASGIPQSIIETKMGILEKPLPGPDDHTVEMGVRAARVAIERAGVDPADIDLVICIGEEHKEYPLWTAGIKIQHDIGAVNAWAFDTALRCGTAIMAIKIAKDMMIADPTIRTVLLAGGYRNVDFIDYSNPRTRFMYNLGAGGGALVLQRGHSENRVLGTHMMTDGSFSEDIVVTTGGTKNPVTKETLEQGLYQLDVMDPAGMKERLDEKSMANFITCVEKALEKSGLDKSDIRYMAMLHMKRSAHQYVLGELGLSEEQSIYLDHYGHIGQIDQILSMELALKGKKIKNGDIVVLVSAGIGYAWGATIIQWGQKEAQS